MLLFLSYFSIYQCFPDTFLISGQRFKIFTLRHFILIIKRQLASFWQLKLIRMVFLSVVREKDWPLFNLCFVVIVSLQEMFCILLEWKGEIYITLFKWVLALCCETVLESWPFHKSFLNINWISNELLIYSSISINVFFWFLFLFIWMLCFFFLNHLRIYQFSCVFK